jgi:BlaI family transcriptional regulator, penicillinase repressor
MQSKSLTRAEEQVMQILWDLEKGFLKDIVDKFPAPKPAYTTVSTVIRVLVKKEFIGFNTYGKINEYYPLISKGDYFKKAIKPILASYSDNAPNAMASYFANAKLSLDELESIKALVQEKINKIKAKKK